MKNKCKGLCQDIFLLGGSIIFTAILAEIVLRMVLPAPIVWKYPQESYLFDSEIGYWLKPNQHAFTHDKKVSTNLVGIRDREFAPEASPGVYRILALGDSQTFGNGLELIDTWPKQLEAVLNKDSREKRFEVLNGGIAGTDIWQHEIILGRLLDEYHPDAVVLAFYVNDVVKRYKPMPVRHEVDKALVPKVAYMLKRSSLLLSLRLAFGTVRQMLFPSRRFIEQRDLLYGRDNPAIMERWVQVEKSLSSMKKITEKRDITFTIAVLPRRDQVDGRVPWKSYSEHIDVIVKRYNISVISLLEPLKQAYSDYGKELFIPWDGHNSKIANSIIAQTIADLLAYDGH